MSQSLVLNNSQIIKGQRRIAKKFNAEFLPDNKGFTNRFAIPNEAGTQTYIVSQRSGKEKSAGEWCCGCKGWIFHRHCKHLDTLAEDLTKNLGGYYGSVGLKQVKDVPKLAKVKNLKRTKIHKALYGGKR